MTVFEIQDNTHHFGKAYAYTIAREYYSPVKALYLLWVATQITKHQKGTA
jgi:hypothetical protein